MKLKHPIMTTLIIYLMILGLAIINQRKLVYMPGQTSFETTLNKIDNLNLHAWPTKQNYLGLIQESNTKHTKATVIVFHGNAGSALDRLYYFDSLPDLGYRVILAEYPGYGGRDGKISEQNLVQDGSQTVKTAAQQFHEPIIIWGESLGTGVAAGIISLDSTLIDSAILLTPFLSMSKVAQHHYWFLFAGYFIWDRYDNANNLKHFNGKTAILLSENDEIIPSKHGKKLYKQIKGRKKLWLFEGANHNDWPKSPSSLWWKQVMEFIENE